uniref:Ribonuclease H-like domain-containing protein n=1 Tax=Tanacetum cinerariifolium TaxID=118510 RepID=A0A6L2K9F5_TANCI|nr:ribonuclease H-like domain-containing protein [Tanacetum cinerariifolium]
MVSCRSFMYNGYSLWEVILNGDSPSPTRIVDGVVQIIAPTTAEQRLAKKNKLKARGTLLMALPDKHQLTFNIHKDAKTLMEAIEKRFGGNKETKKIYEAEVKGLSTSSQNTQNIAFVSSNNTDNTNESVSAIPSVFATSSKATVSTLPNFDSLSDAVIYSFFEMDLKWQMAMLTMRDRRFLKRTERNLGANGTDTIGFDMSKVECYNCHRRGHFAKEYRSPRDNRNKDSPRITIPVEVHQVLQDQIIRKSQFIVLSYKTCLESVEARLVVYQQNENVFEEEIKLLKIDVMIKDNALAELRKQSEKAKKEKDELKLTLDKFQTSSKNLSKLLESQICDKTGLGFDSQVFDRQVFYYKELHSHEYDNSVPKSLENDRYKTGEEYHVVPPPYTGTFMPSKPDLVFNDAPNASESVANVVNVESSTNKPSKDMSKTLRSDAPIIEDWISDSEDETEIESMPKQKEPSFVPTFEHVKTPREPVKKAEHPKQAEHLRTNNQQLVPTAVPQSSMKSPRPIKHVVNKTHSPIRRPINHRPATKNSNFNHKVTTVKVNKVNVIQGNNGNADKASANWVWKLKCTVLDHVSRLISASMTLKKFNYTDALGRSKVPRENNMYNVDLKNVVPSRYLTCLFAKATLDESNVWHRRLGNINFKTMNKLVKVLIEAQQHISNESPPLGVNTPRCDENSIEPMELMVFMGRIDQEEVNDASKGVSAAEPTVFDDEDIAQRLHDEEVEKAAAMDQVQERYLDNIRKYQSLKKKPISIAQARKNMIIYLKNMVGYKMEHFRGMTYDKVRPIFEREYKKVQTLFKPDKDVKELKKKRVVEETLLQESFKKLKAIEVSGSKSTQETPSNDPKEMSEEDVHNMLEIVSVSEFKVKALQVKYPIIDWEIHTEEKDYPLSNVVMTLMLSAKLQVKEDNEMARDLVMKIFVEANKPKRRSLDTSSK